MLQFCLAACLISAAVALPSKLGGHAHSHHDHAHGAQRQARQGGAGGYIAPRDDLAGYGDNAVAVASEVVETREAAPVIGIRSQNFDGPLPEFRYAFETENDIKQEASGELRNVDGADVVVMKGSYSYIGADGLTYQVDWYADETGYHPSAPPLPQPVQPIHPEIVAAVEAQLRFAAEEEAAAAASARSETYAAPLAGYSASL